MFFDNKIESLNLAQGVTHIGEGAFRSNLINSLTLPESLTVIGKESFKDNQLTEVIIMENVTDIGEGAFDNNQEDPEDFKIYGLPGSAAEDYADDNNHTFVPVS